MKVGHGIFMWGPRERQTQRYGVFYLTARTYDDKVSSNLDFPRALEGRRVRVYAVVTESRNSGHAGDRAIGVYPSRPEVGERVEIGVGRLGESRRAEGEVAVVLQPADGRAHFWCDPRPWYRLHDQTVDLYVEETNEAFSPAPPFAPIDADGLMVFANGDGSFQIVTSGGGGGREGN